ncbi:hypothetical protein U1Q18_047724 [Sarracenia purpurea var. burkii]
MSREGIIVFQLIWNVTEQLRGPVPVPDAAPSSVAKTKVALLHKAPEVVSYRVDLSVSRLKIWCPTLSVTRIDNFIPPDGHTAPQSALPQGQGHIHWSLGVTCLLPASSICPRVSRSPRSGDIS